MSSSLIYILIIIENIICLLASCGPYSYGA